VSTLLRYFRTPGGKLALPLLGVNGSRVVPAVLVAATVVAQYGIAGHLAMGREPVLLEMTALDRAIPFLPWTYWIYLTVYCIYFTSCFVQRDRVVLGKFLVGYVIAYTLISVFFVAFPTAFPRELFPLPEELDPATRAVIGFSRATDYPTNCWPSMHVASCVLSAAPLYGRRPRWFAAFCVWSLAICATTLTTKQHYVVDLLPGALYGLAIHVIVMRWIPFQRVEPA